MRQQGQIHPDFYRSPSILALPEDCRAMVPHDWECSNPDPYGCFVYDPAVVWINQRTLWPSQQLGDVERRLELYQAGDEPMLEVWREEGRTYGHWVGWFKKVQGTRQKRLLNSYDPSKMGARQTPVPPSLASHDGDPRKVDDWGEVKRSAAIGNRGEASRALGTTFRLPFREGTGKELPGKQGSNFPESARGEFEPGNANGGGELGNREVSGKLPPCKQGRNFPSSASSSATATATTTANREVSGKDLPGEQGSSLPDGGGGETSSRIDGGASVPAEATTPTTQAELREAMRTEWLSAGGVGGTGGFTDAQLDLAVNGILGTAPGAPAAFAEILEAWGWFLRTGPDGRPRRSLGAATPANFERFGWQSWVARRAGEPAAAATQAREDCDICGGLGVLVLRKPDRDVSFRCRCLNARRGMAGLHPPATDALWEAAQRSGHVVLEADLGGAS